MNIQSQEMSDLAQQWAEEERRELQSGMGLAQRTRGRHREQEVHL